MNYTGRALLGAMAALTMLGGGAAAALADDKHGPDSSHGDAGMASPDRDGVCEFITNEPSDDPDDASGDPGTGLLIPEPIVAVNVLPIDDADANADVPVQRPDFNDPDCQDQFGVDPGDGTDPAVCDIVALGVLPIENVPPDCAPNGQRE